jgi:hypothetical protein
MKSITDSDRRAWLIEKGYAGAVDPMDNLKWEFETKNLTDTQFVDLCLERQLCPSYWRPAIGREVKDSKEGMILLAPGDRARIDQCMKE